MGKFLVVLLLLAVTGCSENQGGEIRPSVSLATAFANGEAPSASCFDLLVEWGSLVRADLTEVEPAGSLVQMYEAEDTMTRWLCLPKGFAEGGVEDESVISGLAMASSDGAGGFPSSSLIFFEMDSYSGLAPCAAAWATADLYVSTDVAVERVNSAIEATTRACSSVDEWWLNLKQFPKVFGVFDYPDIDRWSYLAAVCPTNNASEMCIEARTSGALQP